VSAGIYLHIPFCKQACHYCDFHFATNLKLKESMVDAMCKELIDSRALFANDTISSIYFGGGTPSLLSISDLQQLLFTIRNNYQVEEDAEITLEANPDDMSIEKAQHWYDAGVNRLSIGIQSFKQEDLVWMNRAHHAEQALESIQIAKQTGFTNITIDLIYGLPIGTSTDWENNLEIAFKSGVQHISAYALTVEKGTPLQRLILKNKMQAPEDIKAAEQFEIMLAQMEAHNWEQYEISNFCKDQNYSKHNTSYWKQKPYLGIGPSAHSYINQKRFWNVKNNVRYIEAINTNQNCKEEEFLTVTDIYNEMIMTGLRTKWGFDCNQAQNLTGIDIYERNEKDLMEYVKQGWLVDKDKQLLLTSKGKFMADGIASSLFVLD
jgi:oxygen-independent coproporphyrinogen III oxidase